MECPICSEVFNELVNCPRLLACGHTCCEECLNQVIVSTQITCPTCRSLSIASSPSSLPKNYIVLEFISNHMTPEQQTAKTKLSKQCPTHPDELVIRYCIDDNKGVCAECILGHGAHKLVKLDDPVLEFRFEFAHLLGTVQEMDSATVAKRCDVQSKSLLISDAVQRELDRVDAQFAKLWGRLEERKGELKAKVEQNAHECHERILKETADIDVFSGELAEYLVKLQSVSETLDSIQPKEISNSASWAAMLTASKREVHVLFSTSQQLGTIDPISLFSTKTLFNFKTLEQEISKFGIVSVSGDMMNPSIFCFGTQNTVLKFNLGTQRWTHSVIKEHDGYEFKNFASIAALPNGNILITGGTKSNEVFEYLDNRMVKRGNMLHIRSSHNAVYYNGFVYCIGGYNGSSWHDKCEKISTENYNSLAIGNLNFRRCAFSSCVTGNSIYVFGGYDGTKYLDSVERYVMAKNKWEVLLCVLHRPLQNTGAAYYAENKIMISGGYNEKGTLSVVRSLNLETLKWTTMPTMNFTRYLMNKFHCCGGCVFAIGGTAQGQNIEYFNVAEGRWVCMKSYREMTEDTMYKWAAVITDDNH